ncbi:hypothetical protein JW906_13605 [bacterium]|nr:hypothetical protein [bacterium]
MRASIKTALALLGSAMLMSLCTGSSCDKGTEPKKSGSLTGKWRMVRVLMKDTPVGNLTLTAESFLAASGTGATSSVLQINEDGSASVTTTYEDSSVVVVPGTWTRDGDQLTLDGAGIDDTVTCQVDGDTLTLTLIMPIDFDQDGTADDTEIDMIYSRE